MKIDPVAPATSAKPAFNAGQAGGADAAVFARLMESPSHPAPPAVESAQDAQRVSGATRNMGETVASAMDDFGQRFQSTLRELQTAPPNGWDDPGELLRRQTLMGSMYLEIQAVAAVGRQGSKVIEQVTRAQ